MASRTTPIQDLLPLAQVPVQAVSAPPGAETPERAGGGPGAPGAETAAVEYRLQISAPPLHGAYGLLEAGSRRIWLSPISFELGIARQTFLHEVVLAVQSCPTGKVTLVVWTLQVLPVVLQEMGGILTTRYHNHRVAEQEASLSRVNQVDGPSTRLSPDTSYF